MKTIAFVIPWSGKLPDYFQVWLQSCASNPSVDFLLFTSEPMPGPMPENVKHFPLDFEQLRGMFQANFDFPICMDTPYKFCDFKPSYGEVFAKYLSGYDFWGHCDIDLIWGDIRRFVTEDVLAQYNRIYTRGHCTIYRNIPEVNALYRTLPHEGLLDWKYVFTHEGSFCFDEWGNGGLSRIIKENGIPNYNVMDMADLDISKGWLSPRLIPEYQSEKTNYFEWQNGRLWVCTAEGMRKEVLYVHFQKRKLTFEPYDKDHFYLFAVGLISSDRSHIGKRDRRKEKNFERNYWKKRIIGKLGRMCKGLKR